MNFTKLLSLNLALGMVLSCGAVGIDEQIKTSNNESITNVGTEVQRVFKTPRILNTVHKYTKGTALGLCAFGVGSLASGAVAGAVSFLGGFFALCGLASRNENMGLSGAKGLVGGGLLCFHFLRAACYFGLAAGGSFIISALINHFRKAAVTKAQKDTALTQAITNNQTEFAKVKTVETPEDKTWVGNKSTEVESIRENMMEGKKIFPNQYKALLTIQAPAQTK